MKISRRRFFKRFLLAGGAVAGLAAVQSFGIEPNIVVVRRFSLPVSGLPDAFVGKTIAHISDLHCGSSTTKDFLLRAVAKMNSLNPDFVVITGDFTTRYDKGDFFDDLNSVLASVESNHGKFACLGNHDYGVNLHTYKSLLRGTTDCLEANSITLLRNNSTVLEIDGEKVYIVGLGDFIRRDCRPERAFKDLNEGFPRLVIAHSPDCIAACDGFEYDAFICGHTHGGQVCLPFYGAIIVPSDDRRFKKGLYSYRDKFVYVNSGLGTLPTSLPGPRFLCPPEITLYTLNKK